MLDLRAALGAGPLDRRRRWPAPELSGAFPGRIRQDERGRSRIRRDGHKYHGHLGPIPDGIPDGTLFSAPSDYYGCNIVIQHTGPDLLLKMGTPGLGRPAWTFKLSRLEQSPSTYIYATTGENEVGLSAIDFTWQDNVLTGIDDAWLEDSGPGLGEFKRRS